MRLSHGTKKPTVQHAECSNNACNGYFNIYQQDTNELCKACNRKRKVKEEVILKRSDTAEE